MGVKETIKKGLEGIVDRCIDLCHAYPQAFTGSIAGISTASFFGYTGFSAVESVGAGIMAFAAASIIHSSMTVSKNKDRFRNLPSYQESQEELERKIKEFESSEEGKNRGWLTKIKDSVLEHPVAVSASLTAAYFADSLHYELVRFPLMIGNYLTGGDAPAQKIFNIAAYYSKIVPMEISVFAASLLASYLARDLFHSAFYKSKKYYFQGLGMEIKGRYTSPEQTPQRWREAFENAIERYRKAEQAGETYHGKISSLYMKLGMMDMAFKELSHGFRAKAAIFGYFDSITRMMSLNNELKLKRAIKRDAGELKNWLQLAYHHHLRMDDEESSDAMEETEQRFPKKPEIKCLHSIMLEETDKEKSRKKLREAVEIIKNDPELRKKMRIVDESAHRIYELESPFLGDMFKFKEGPADKFMREAMLTLYLRKILGNYPQFETVEPIDIFSDEVGGLYVMKHAQGIPLADIGEQKFYYYLAAAEALGIVHAVMPRNLGKINHHESLKPAIYDSAFLDEKTKTGLFGACAGILQGFDYLPAVFMKDHHPKNILIAKEKGQHDYRLILLDFDDKGAAYASFDTAKLTEQGSNFGNSFIGDQRRFEVVKRYVESFNEHERDNGYRIHSNEEFFINHLRSAVIKALSFYFFSARMPAREQERVSFIENAAHCINVLKEWFGDEYNRGESHYKSMAGLLAGLPKTNKELAGLQN